MILLQDPGAWGPSHLAARSLVLSFLLCSWGVGAGHGAGRKGPTPTLVPVAADLGRETSDPPREEQGARGEGEKAPAAG